MTDEHVPEEADEGVVEAVMDLTNMIHALMVQRVDPSQEFLDAVRGMAFTFMTTEGGISPTTETEALEMMGSVGKWMVGQAAILQLNKAAEETDHAE